MLPRSLLILTDLRRWKFAWRRSTNLAGAVQICILPPVRALGDEGFNSARRLRARFADAQDFQRAAEVVVEGRDARLQLDDGVADGFKAEAAVGSGEDFAFDDAGVVADRDELHGVAGDLMMRAVGDDEAADGDALAGIAGEIADGAIGVPCDIGKLIERVAGDGEAEEFGFVAEALGEVGFGERHFGEAGAFVALEKVALGVRPLGEVLEMPELRGARCAVRRRCRTHRPG